MAPKRHSEEDILKLLPVLSSTHTGLTAFHTHWPHGKHLPRHRLAVGQHDVCKIGDAARVGFIAVAEDCDLRR